jgi:hypothetical protein
VLGRRFPRKIWKTGRNSNHVGRGEHEVHGRVDFVGLPAWREWAPELNVYQARNATWNIGWFGAEDNRLFDSQDKHAYTNEN